MKVRFVFGCISLLFHVSLGRHESALIPLRYDIQIQLPTSSSVDPLIPTFFAALRLDFQITKPLFSHFRGQIDPRHNQTFKGQGHRRPPIAHQERPLQPEGTELWFAAKDLEGFENVTLTNDHRIFGVIDVRLEDGFVVFVVAEPALTPGRYSLHIDRYVGIISDEHGVIYRDVGGFALIATNLFPDFARSIMPCLTDPMRKVSIRLSILHPQNTIALANMQQEHSSFETYENWRLTDFVQVANLPSFMFSFSVLPEIFEKSRAASRYPVFVFTNNLKTDKSQMDEIVGLAGTVYDEVYNLMEEPLPFTHINLIFFNEFNGTQSTGLLFFDGEAWLEADDCHRIEMLAKAYIRQWM